MERNPDLHLLRISIAGFLLLSVSFLMMPIPHMSFVPGILFWTGLTVAIIMQITLEARRRAFFKKRNLDRKRFQKPRCGALLFFTNTGAKIADIAVLGTLTALIISSILTGGTGYICFLFMGAFVFSLSMHCILNGRNYFHAHNRRRIGEALERKKSQEKGKGEE